MVSVNVRLLIKSPGNFVWVFIINSSCKVLSLKKYRQFEFFLKEKVSKTRCFE